MDKGLVTGNTYYYKVRTFCTSGGKKIYSDYSDPASMQVLPGKPSIQVVAANYNTITVSWKKVEGCDGYRVYRATEKDGKYKSVKTCSSVNTLSYKNSKLETGKTYYYKIYAVRGEYVSATTDCVSVISSALEVSTTSVLIKTGTSVKVTATAKPYGVVYWSSANSMIAVVSSDGTIYGLKAGTTTVKASANGITKEITVTVKDKLETENKIIDISSDNGTVDFNAIKAAGYECVMLRISKGTTADAKFQTNYKNAKAAGLKVGVYCYSLAQNAAQAKAEGDKVLNLSLIHI